MSNEINMIYTACQLERSLRGLRVIAVPSFGESREEAETNSKLDNGLVGIVLYTMIVELTIKGLWSYENNGKEPEPTHDIQKIFNQLKRSKKSHIKKIYNKICRSYIQAISVGKQKLGEDNIQVEMASLEEALQWNKDAMVHLQYDLNLKGKTVPAGAIWDSNRRIWFGNDNNLPNFASALVRWARGKLSM